MRKPVLFIPGFPASELRDRSTGQTVFPPSFATLIDPQKKAELIQRRSEEHRLNSSHSS